MDYHRGLEVRADDSAFDSGPEQREVHVCFGVSVFVNVS